MMCERYEQLPLVENTSAMNLQHTNCQYMEKDHGCGKAGIHYHVSLWNGQPKLHRQSRTPWVLHRKADGQLN